MGKYGGKIMRNKIVGILVCMLLIAASTSISLIALADWNPEDGHKMHYPQLPDDDGWDVYATAGLTGYPELCLADDWMCSESGPVTDIHFWGSWLDDNEGMINSFVITIYSDIPADPPTIPYSRPGNMLWEQTFYPGEWAEFYLDSPGQGWYEPSSGFTEHPNHFHYFQYNIVGILDPFIQEEGTIYWLSISAIVEEVPDPQPLWGWKSTEDHWNDDACWTYRYDLNWIDLWEPSEPIVNDFYAGFDMAGMPIPGLMGGTGYYDDGMSMNGWYEYPSGWWNIWFYDHPLDYDRMKIIETHLMLSQWMQYEESWVDIAINWATDSWAGYEYPPLPGYSEELYIGREIIYSGPAPEFQMPVDAIYEILEYNPEWVSMDVMGSNFIIEAGIIEHTCLGSLDLAFVITGDGGGPDNLEFGDAPEVGIAYPSLGVTGAFPTCKTCGTAGWIQHNNFGASFGPSFDFETDGNAGLCPNCFPTYDDDECFMDGDAGLIIPEPFTIDSAWNVIPCPSCAGTPLGFIGQTAIWGANVDIEVHNHMPSQTTGYVNVLMDWDQNGAWSGSAGGAPEHVLVNFPIPNPYDGPLSGLMAIGTGFLTGANPGYVWTRFSITETPVQSDWNGEGAFEDGETEDYLLLLEEELGWCWKAPHPNYAPHTPGGMPDFDQKQDNWKAIDAGPDGIADTTAIGDDVQVSPVGSIPGPYAIVVAPGANCHLDTQPASDDVADWAFCGPVAVANCFWWFDSKFADPLGYPGDGVDDFSLVQDYGVGDDHLPTNVPYLIEDLASRMQTCEKGTTDIQDMQDAIDQWFIDTGLDDLFVENTYYAPEFSFIEGEIERSQDVILLLGLYDRVKIVDQEQPIWTSYIDLPPWTPGHLQSFTPSVSVLNAVQVLLAASYPGTDTDIKVCIWDQIPNPSINPLGCSVMTITPPLIGEPEWFQFHFDLSISLIPGGEYFISVEELTTSANIHWYYYEPDMYPGGMAWYETAAWTFTPQPEVDFCFRTEYYGEESIRKDGHYVTCSGVNFVASKIAFSDPARDVADTSGYDHNDAQYASHDIYDVSIGCPCFLPYQWWLPYYPSEYWFTIVEQAVVICPDATQPDLVEITSLSDQWNLVSSLNSSIAKADLWVGYGGVNYTWTDAVSGGIVADAFFGWDRTIQGYLLYNTLVPGYSYWLWAYYDCILKVAV